MATSSSSPRTLLIDDGSLAGLAAVALSERPEHAILWHPVSEAPGASRREEMAREHASIFKVEAFVEARVMGCPGEGMNIADAAMILAAAQAAHERQCRRIVWPLHVGEEFEGLSRAYEMVLMLCQMIDFALCDGEHDPFESTLETPFLDLTDSNLVEVASKSHAPLWAARWCEGDRTEPCMKCESCQRWGEAFRAADIALPTPSRPRSLRTAV